jgi:hypothetical protein
MRTIQPVGSYRDIVEARDPGNHALVVKLGLRKESFEQFSHHYLFTAVAQYYGIVQDGVLAAIHAFRGLKRPLMHGDDKEADKTVIVYSWRPEHDFIWIGSRFGDGSGREHYPVQRTSPPNRVLVVLVREEKQPNHYPGVGNVFGSIERWNWVKEDPVLPHAPVGWTDRYEEKLWSRL